MSDDDFSNHPVSLADIRSSKSNNGAEWSPRDALIDCLRRIDKDEIEPETLIVCMRLPSEHNSTRISFRCSSPNPLITIGMLEITKKYIMDA